MKRKAHGAGGRKGGEWGSTCDVRPQTSFRCQNVTILQCIQVAAATALPSPDCAGTISSLESGKPMKCSLTVVPSGDIVNDAWNQLQTEGSTTAWNAAGGGGDAAAVGGGGSGGRFTCRTGPVHRQASTERQQSRRGNTAQLRGLTEVTLWVRSVGPPRALGVRQLRWWGC